MTPVFATSSPLPRAYKGQAQDAFIIVNGGKAPYAFTVTSGSLPPGITSSTTADDRFELQSSPTTNGSYSFTITAIDAANVSTSKAFVWNVTDPIIVTSTTLPKATNGQSYSFTFVASGGTGSGYSGWRLVSGTLPTGIALDTSGHLSGVPNGTGTFSFSVTCTDNGNDGAVAFMGEAPPNALSSIDLVVQ
jgi:hypothetical protein